MSNKLTHLILAALLLFLVAACGKEPQEQEDKQSLDFTLSFVGAGESIKIDSVNVENINTNKHISLKGGEALRLVSTVSANTNGQKLMQYNYRDKLRITGRSGSYCTIISEVVGESKSITITFVACTDADKNNYPVVKIGDRFWMAENLRTTKYRNGSKIQSFTSFDGWYKLSSSAFCFYDNKDANSKIYGNLYNWYAAKNDNIAPLGWHVATKDEWYWLIENLGGQTQIGGMLKESGTTYWLSPNKGATNSSGFSARPGGRTMWTEFQEVGMSAHWWSSAEADSQIGIPQLQGISFNIDNSYEAVGINFMDDKRHGLSIRCVKDN